MRAAQPRESPLKGGPVRFRQADRATGRPSGPDRPSLGSPRGCATVAVAPVAGAVAGAVASQPLRRCAAVAALCAVAAQRCVAASLCIANATIVSFVVRHRPALSLQLAAGGCRLWLGSGVDSAWLQRWLGCGSSSASVGSPARLCQTGSAWLHSRSAPAPARPGLRLGTGSGSAPAPGRLRQQL